MAKSYVLLGLLAATLARASPFNSDSVNLHPHYYNDGPTTGVTREYWWEITEFTAALDGVAQSVMAINGSIPGPTLFADWGDTVVVHVTNSMSTNGTSIHFHGIRQNYTNPNDGVSSITQCPVAAGSSITYTWKATQYGTTWYHSHYGPQAYDGVFGGIVINGPASADYDEDLGDNHLINGTNIYVDGDTTVGSRFNVSFTAGTSYRVRLINAAMDIFFMFSIDNHTMEVIANGLVPIQPFNTSIVSIGIGQRYDVIIRADQSDTADNFWIRAVPQTSCSSTTPGRLLPVLRSVAAQEGLCVRVCDRLAGMAGRGLLLELVEHRFEDCATCGGGWKGRLVSEGFGLWCHVIVCDGDSTCGGGPARLVNSGVGKGARIVELPPEGIGKNHEGTERRRALGAVRALEAVAVYPESLQRKLETIMYKWRRKDSIP
ncbi:Cupredoxin [Chaetomium strumarium]|uniref:Cupredoxin n=1 Tax=Chaetomium strumarium TaxID=1170767 RepID=A0AAJ0M198_9PEZI|nr:Cupredoxin [Chaetomium strumarium]